MSNVSIFLEDTGDEVIGKMKKILTSNRKRATGSLINSLEYSIKDKEIQISYEPYGEFVAQGRRPGAKPPPIKPIMEWLKVKRIPIGQGKQKTMVKKGKKAPKDSLLKAMAFAVSKSIGKKGIKPVDFLVPLKVFKTAKFKNGLREAILLDINEIMNKNVQG